MSEENVVDMITGRLKYSGLNEDEKRDENLKVLLASLRIRPNDFDVGVNSMDYISNVLDVYGTTEETSFLDLNNCFLFERALSNMVKADGQMAYANEIFSDEAKSIDRALTTILKQMASASGVDVDGLSNIMKLDGKYMRAVRRMTEVRADWRNTLWKMESTYELSPNSSAIKIAEIMGIKALSAEETLNECLARLNSGDISRFGFMMPRLNRPYVDSSVKIRFEERGERKVFNPQEGFVVYGLSFKVTGSDFPDKPVNFILAMGRLRNKDPYRIFEIDDQSNVDERDAIDEAKKGRKLLEDEVKIYGRR